MKRPLIIALVVLIAGGLIWYVSSRKAPEPTDAPTGTSEEAANPAQGGEEVTAGMPVPGEDVSETEVVEDADMKVFEISGVNFAFSEEEIRVQEGDTVRIVFTSESGFHDWVVDEFDAATEQVQTGGVTEVTFVADKAGTYEYYCSVGQHRANGMVGNLIVE